MANANDKSQALERLARMIQSVETAGGSPVRLVATGWPGVDAALGGLRAGAIHEFLGPLPAGALQEAGSPPLAPGRGQASVSPICLLASLVRQACSAAEGEIVWVGKRCWPNPQMLARLGLLDRSVFVATEKASDRLWATELAARSAAVAAVVGDAESFTLPATRRLELAAREGTSLVLLSRPGRELAMPSAATTRWAVYRRVCDSVAPAWTLELIRCKGRQVPHSGRWPMEWDCAKGAVIVSAAVVDRQPSAKTAALLRSIG